ncbi:peptide ABC transporter permease [Cytobacillus firmus]|nr:peptide ABC transporter permease [Cytobacillus firmus]MBG9552743.1 peptide ABC transporter permease [Cytobacillus firmus]MBG9556079.1 peptide ABC transporter permease [Cytobacillus firmus]MBG9574326.1 peptide ABC transporter permease [Cytobacillus firmus]SUV00934.1 binding-protein-dependent transport system inner membrane protein [Cytobacillus firmus]
MYSFKSLIKQLIGFFLLLILAAIPLVFHNTGDPLQSQQQIIFHPQQIVILIKDFIAGIFSLDAFYYKTGSNTRFFPADIVAYFKSSYFYLTSSGLIVITLSFLFGIWLWKTSVKYLNGTLSFLGMIPDFIFILLMQLLVNFIYKTTGIKTVKVASLSMDDPALFLPIVTLVLIPLIYLIRALNEHTHEVISEDYILTAIGKGLSKPRIYLFHVTTNVLPYLKADLKKITGIMISNLFVVEYLYNTRGVTTMLFQIQVKFGYQYNLVVLCLISIMLLYTSVFYTYKLFISIIERILRHA